MAKLDRDGYVDIEFNADRTQAFATIYPPQGSGTPVSAKEVMDRLRTIGVIYGFLESHIVKATKCAADDNIPVVKALVAQGVLPQDGTDAQVTWQIDEKVVHAPFPRRSDGLPDYFALDASRVVAAGQVLATIIPAREGSPGKTLTAPLQPVRQNAGRDTKMIAGNGVRLSDDRIRFAAIDDGFVELTNDRLMVHALKLIDGDLPAGNHAFSGGAIVRGNVNGGSIKANGVLAVKGTIIGTSVRSHDDVYLNRAEGATFVTEGTIYVLGAMIGCTVNTRAKVVTLDEGMLAGGDINATEGVETYELGTGEFLETRVTVGVDELSALRLEEMEEEIRACEANSAKISQALKAFAGMSADRLPPDKKPLVQQLTDQRQAYERRVNELSNQKRMLTVRSKNTGEGTVTVKGVVHPGVWISVRSATTLVEMPQERVVYTADQDGRAVFTRPLSQKPAGR